MTRRYGPPGVLVYEEVALPALRPDEMRIRSIASAPWAEAMCGSTRIR